MSGGKTPSNTTTTTKTELPSQLQPYVPQFLGNAAQVAGQPYQSYGGPRIAPVTGEQEAGLQMTANRALNGSPVLNAAQDNLTSTLRGDFLDPTRNPAWQPSVQRISDAYSKGTAAQTDAAFSRAGAFGGSAHQEQMADNQRGFGDSLAGLYGNLWNQERGNQQRAAFAAPQIAQADYADLDRLLHVGDIRRENTQDALNMAFEEFMRQQAYPQQQLDIFGNALRTAAGGQSQSSATQPNPFRPSRSAGALGGAAAWWCVGRRSRWRVGG